MNFIAIKNRLRLFFTNKQKMSQQEGIIFVDSNDQRQPLLQQQMQPQRVVQQRPVRLNQPQTIQQVPRTAVARQRSGAISRGGIICIIILIILVVVGAIVAAFFLQGITNKDKSGCTESHYDNFMRGFGIDDGSCFFNQQKHDKTIKTCPQIRSFFYDVGGVDANYTPLEWENVVVNATTSFVLNGDDPDDDLCFTINSFDVAGGANCNAASLKISGSDGQDGTYCDTNSPPIGSLICVNSVGTLDFTWYSDGKTNATGWEIEFECGIVGCTIEGASNYNAEATIDDGSCIILPLTSTDNIIELCPEDDIFFYDSGGPDEDYSNDEFVITQFKSSDPTKRLKFTYEQFNINGVNSDCESAGLIIDYRNDTTTTLLRCNQKSNPGPGSNINGPVGGITKFFFYSNSQGPVSAGWRIKIQCQTP